MIDVAQWFLDDPYPASAVAMGGNLAWKDGREISDTAEYVFEFPKAWLLTFSSRLGIGPGGRFRGVLRQGPQARLAQLDQPHGGAPASGRRTRT